MGVNLGWIAVRTRQPEEVFEVLGLEPTGAEDVRPVSPLSATTLAMGWTVILVRENAYVGTTVEMAERLSREHEVIQVIVEEEALCAMTARYAGGERTWAVGHDGRKGEDHLAVHGREPIELSGIRAWHEHDLRGNPQTESLFDVPIDLAKRLVGFRHDEDLPGLKKAHWRVLARCESPVPVPVPEPAPAPERVPVPVPEPAPAQVATKHRKTERRLRRAAKKEARRLRRRRTRERYLRARQRGFFGHLGDAIREGLRAWWAYSQNRYGKSLQELEDERRKELLADSRARRKARARERRRERRGDQRP